MAGLGQLAAWYIKLVYHSARIRRTPDDLDQKLLQEDPQIFCTWHGQFLLSPMMRPDWVPEVVAMVARHGDAEFIAAALKPFGTHFARGAGAGDRKRDRGGAQALREAVRALGRGATIVITADVPPGPARRASKGLVTMAQLSGRPMVPFAMATKHFLAFKTWSALTINLPFSTLGIAVGDAVRVKRDASEEEIEEARLALEKGLNEAMAKAYALAGSDDPLSEAYQEKMNRPGLLLKTYRALTFLGKPFVPALLAFRARHGKEETEHRPERYGIASLPRPDGFLIWFHAASVGEANSVLPLIETLSEARPDLRILLTTGTVTSAMLARARLPKTAIHQYVPLDNQDYMRRFLQHWHPDLAVLIESEIWPNLLLEAKREKVPLVLINGRVSQRSYRRWRRLSGLSRPLFSAFSLVLAQNSVMARNFTKLGAPKAIGVGNLKADSPPPPADLPGRTALEESLAGRTVFLAASTHAGEEDLVARAHLALREEIPDLLTIIVPRHPERGPGIVKELQGLGLSSALRSRGALPSKSIDIYIADTIGELGMFYAQAPVSFIGGSLVKHGGQNPVEAIKLGSAVLTGPSWYNFRDSYSELIAGRACIQVEDAPGLADAALALLRNGEKREAMMKRAETSVQEMSGALEKTLSELQAFLPPVK